jgi:hypothetical protein
MSGIAAIGALAVIVGTATTVLIAELIERVSSSRDHGRSRRPDPAGSLDGFRARRPK